MWMPGVPLSTTHRNKWSLLTSTATRTGMACNLTTIGSKHEEALPQSAFANRKSEIGNRQSHGPFCAPNAHYFLNG